MSGGKARVVVKIVLWSVIPMLLTFLGRAHMDLTFLQDAIPVFANVSPSVFKDCFLLLGMALSVIAIDIQFACTEFEKKLVTSQRMFLIQYIKTIFIESLEAKLGDENTGINIRVFVPKKGKLYIAGCLLKKLTGSGLKFRKEFVINNMECLSEPGITNGLSFQVEPESQGLIGLCYRRRTFVYEEDLKKSVKNLKLTDFQRDKLSNTVFWLCVPVIDKTDEIIAILSLDSRSSIHISKLSNDELARAVTNFSQFFEEGLPDLLKRRR